MELISLLAASNDPLDTLVWKRRFGVKHASRRRCGCSLPPWLQTQHWSAGSCRGKVWRKCSWLPPAWRNGTSATTVRELGQQRVHEVTRRWPDRLGSCEGPKWTHWTRPFRRSPHRPEASFCGIGHAPPLVSSWDGNSHVKNRQHSRVCFLNLSEPLVPIR